MIGRFGAEVGHGLIEDLEGALGCCLESRQWEGKVRSRGANSEAAAISG